MSNIKTWDEILAIRDSGAPLKSFDSFLRSESSDTRKSIGELFKTRRRFNIAFSQSNIVERLKKRTIEKL